MEHDLFVQSTEIRISISVLIPILPVLTVHIQLWIVSKGRVLAQLPQHHYIDSKWSVSPCLTLCWYTIPGKKYKRHALNRARACYLKLPEQEMKTCLLAPGRACQRLHVNMKMIKTQTWLSGAAQYPRSWIFEHLMDGAEVKVYSPQFELQGCCGREQNLASCRVSLVLFNLPLQPACHPLRLT